MNAATLTLPNSVPANADFEISVPMTAPANKTGPIKGNWQMATTGTATGTKPIVTSTATATSTSTETSAPTSP